MRAYGKLMTIAEWRRLLKDASVLDESFTVREANLAFSSALSFTTDDVRAAHARAARARAVHAPGLRRAPLTAPRGSRGVQSLDSQAPRRLTRARVPPPLCHARRSSGAPRCCT